MKTVGEILKKERIRQKRSLEDISQKTKIPQPTLESIEKDNYEGLPAQAFVKGFIRNYALELNLDPEKILAVYRRDHQIKKRDRLIPEGLSDPLDKSFSLTPKITLILSSAATIFILAVFFFFQIKGYLFAPPLKILSPKNGEIIHNQSVEIKGKTITDTTVFINEQPVNVNFDGSFTSIIKLLPGENILKIKAVNRKGKETLVKLRLIVDKNP